jgi:hypothetical protein
LGADRRLSEALEVVPPADEVVRGLFGRQVAVLERDAGARPFSQQTDLDRAASGREGAAARVAPQDAKTMWWVDLEVRTADRDALMLTAKRPPGRGSSSA